jgi:tetratricopeptide (TPR) repeat protein
MKTSIFRSTHAKLFIALALVFATTSANAQRSMEERRNTRQSQQARAQQQEAQYPEATRQAPEAKGSARMASQLKRMVDAFSADKADVAMETADAILAADNATNYDKALAARVKGSIQLNEDPAAAIDSFAQAIELDALSNNEHYEMMWYLGQLQAQEDRYDDALATLDRLLTETNAQKPEHVGFKGVVLYQLERYPEAIAALESAVASAPTPPPQWSQMLMAAYTQTDQGAKATELAERLAASTPDDTLAQRNLATVYLQSDQPDKAIEVYEWLRAAGQLTEQGDYRNLVILYMGSDGQERKAIEVINAGLAAGVLKPGYETHVMLAQAYYFTDQLDQAIESYQKAAPLAPDGETYLNLARALWAAGRMAEAKQAAQQALDKGIRSPEDARTILRQPG